MAKEMAKPIAEVARAGAGRRKDHESSKQQISGQKLSKQRRLKEIGRLGK